MPRSLIPLVWAFSLWNLIAVFSGIEIVFGSHSLAGDFIAAMITLAIVLFGVATAELRASKKYYRLRFLWWFVICCGFIFAVVGNFSFLPRLFHSPETAPTPATIFWDEILSARGILLLVFTLISSMFATLHGKLPPSSSTGSVRLFRPDAPSP